MRTPSLYKHVASLQDLSDALFSRGLAESLAAVESATTSVEEGWPRIREILAQEDRQRPSV